MPTLNDVALDKKKRRFTNRTNEISLFGRLIEVTKPEYNILCIYGYGGVGKSFLLDKFQGICEERGIRCVRLDGSAHQTIVKIVHAIRSQMGNKGWFSHFRKFDQDLKRYLEIQGKLEKNQVTQNLIHLFISAGGMIDPTGTVNTIGKETIGSGLSALSSLLNQPDIEFYIQADIALTKSLMNAISKLNEKKLVILIDAFEKLSDEIKQWVEEVLARNISDQTILIIGSRQRLDHNWANWESDEILKQVELLNFNEKHTYEYLHKLGVQEEELIKEIFTFTQGHPLCVSLAMQYGIRSDNKYIVMDTLIERILGAADPEQLRSLKICAVPRSIDQDVINALDPEKKIKLEDIRHLLFIREVNGKIVLHDLIRNYLNQRFEKESPAQWESLNKTAVLFNQELLKKKKGAERKDISLEVLYHHLNVSEGEGVEYAIQLFTQVEITLDTEYALAIINKLEEFTWKYPGLSLWIRLFRAEYEYVRCEWKKALDLNFELINQDNIDSMIQLRATNNIASIRVLQNRLEEGRFYAEKALTLAERIGNENSIMTAIYTLSRVYQRQGHEKSGIDLITKLLSQPFTFEANKALLSERLGLLYLSSRQADDAEKAYQMAWTIWNTLGNKWKMAMADYGIAGVLSERKNWVEAIQLLEKSLKVLEDVGDLDGLAKCLSRLARAKSAVRVFDQAVEHIQNAIIIDRETGDQYAYIKDICILAIIDREMGSPEKALAHYQEALALSSASGNFGREVSILLNLARTYEQLDEKQNASNYAERAYQLAQKICNDGLMKEALSLQSRISSKE